MARGRAGRLAKSRDLVPAFGYRAVAERKKQRRATGERLARLPEAGKEADGAKGGTFCEVLWNGRKTTVPPAIHAGTGKPYEWLDPAHTLFNTRVVELPAITIADIDALEAAIKPWTYERPPPPEETGKILDRASLDDIKTKRYRAYAQSALAGRVEDLKAVKGGGRNWELYASARYLGKWVHHGFLGEDEMIRELAAACNHNALTRDDGGKRGVLATIRSGLKKAINDPFRELKDIGPSHRRMGAPGPRRRHRRPIVASAGNRGPLRARTRSPGEAAPQWDRDDEGKRLLTEHNALLAFALEGVSFRYDEFAYEEQIVGL